MKYNEYKNTDYAKIGEDVLAFWKENKIFEKSVSEREGKPAFNFYEGPPSANGVPGIHHVMARTVKDIFCRFKTLKGFQVKRKGGWDTHGLPVELQVEKELGIKKEDIGTKISVKEYNQKCRESVMKFTGLWEKITEKMGYWVDMKDPYITYEKKYIESLWNLLKRLHDKDLLYKGFTIQPFSPAAGTGLSSHELNQPGCYQDVKDTTVVAQFKVTGTENDYFLAWTTTPWTLPSNSALAVGAKINYVKVKTFNAYTFEPINVILAKDLMGKYFTEKQKKATFEDYKAGDKLIPFEVVGEYTGEELVGMSYEQLLPFVTPEKEAFKVIPGDFVSTEDGTGIVHIAPTFGADDQRVAQQAGIPPIMVKDEEDNDVPLVNKQGRFVKEVTEWAGEYVKEAYEDADKLTKEYKSMDVRIAIKLKTENKAFKVEKYEHSYPHCWRTDKPVLYYPMESWFIKTTAYKDRLVELNKTINWKPESTGTGRFGNWLENLVDWNLSRSRFWGTPLPIWRTEDGTEEICIGSIAELEAEIEKASELNQNWTFSKEELDLHRPYVDEIVLKSSKGEPMYRETDLIDVWFDSGAMPFAQLHYPFENEEEFKTNYPADFIAEGVDQTRGWFFTLHALSVMLEDSVAFKNVIANGLVLDKKGNKMSKRHGNAVDPFETIDKYGPDATRWYMITNASPWDNLKFDVDGVQESQRKFFGTLQNTYAFFALYANIDGFNYSEGAIPLEKRTESDRWIISKLNSLVKEVETSYETYEPTKAGRAIQKFVTGDMSNWYVRLNRKRFWKGEYNEDKRAAYQTLFECLEAIAKIASPIAPFFCERLFQDLNKVTNRSEAESVHLATYPTANEEAIDIALEERMQLAQTVSSLVHSIRKKEKLKVRMPLSKVLIPVNNDQEAAQIKAVEELILTEVNVKGIEFLGEENASILVKRIKANFKKLGKSYGKQMKTLAGLISKMSQADISTLEANNAFELELEGKMVTLTTDDVEISFDDIPGWAVAKAEGVTIALDITITEELREEGLARDIVNRIQNIRKDMGLEIKDKIAINVKDDQELVNKALNRFKEYVCVETQALALDFTTELATPQVLEIDEVTVELQVSVN